MPAERHPSSSEIWQRYHATGAGDISEEELVKQYLPLVKTVVGRLAVSLPPHVETDDLYSAGLVGLLQAIRQFQPDKGASFESYARVRIRGSVLDELRRMDWVPRSVHAKARRIQSALVELEHKLRRTPTSEEAAAALEISVDEYHRWLDQVRPASFVCLDAVQSPDGDDDCSEHEVIADVTQQDASEKATQSERVAIISEQIKTLPVLHQKIIAFYYFEGMRLREIAEICNLSESRICQIHTQVVLSLKAHLEAQDTLSSVPTHAGS